MTRDDNLVFSATFTDDTSAVFMTNLPEPTALAPPEAAACIAVCGRCRRCRAPAPTPPMRFLR